MTNLEFALWLALIWISGGILSTIGTAHWFLLSHAIKAGDRKRTARNVKRIFSHVIFWVWRS